MRSFIKKIPKSFLVVPALLLSLVFAAPVTAQADCSNVTSGGIGAGAECAAPTDAATELFGPNSIFQTITNILLFLIGAISVIMLIVGGIRYVLSNGEQANITGAKNTILYAIIGLVIAFLAYAAIRFVTQQLNNSTGSVNTVAIVQKF